MLPTLLGAERISASESSVRDKTTLELGNTNYHMLPDCFQSINANKDVSTCPTFESLTIDDCIGYLNLLKIKFPFPKSRMEELINTKF